TGEIKTELWLSPFPTLTNWVNHKLQNLGARQVECRPLFRSPLVFATLDERGPHLSENPVSWEEIFPGEEFNGTFLQLDPLASSIGLLSYLQLYKLARPEEERLSEELAPATLIRLQEFSKHTGQYGSN